MSENVIKKQFYVSLVIWFFVIAAIRVFSMLQNVPFIHENMGVITAILLVYPPVLVSIYEKSRIQYWQLDKLSLILNLKIFLLISIIIFPAAFVVNHFYQNIIFGLTYHHGKSNIWGIYILTQLLLIALPEELFFRGYLQEVFHKFKPPQWKIFGASFGWSTVLIALIFALSHSLIALQWWHGFIFFPALLFSWLKEKTGTIWASVLFHGTCNVFAYWVAVHY